MVHWAVANCPRSATTRSTSLPREPISVPHLGGGHRKGGRENRDRYSGFPVASLQPDRNAPLRSTRPAMSPRRSGRWFPEIPEYTGSRRRARPSAAHGSARTVAGFLCLRSTHASRQSCLPAELRGRRDLQGVIVDTLKGLASAKLRSPPGEEQEPLRTTRAPPGWPSGCVYQEFQGTSVPDSHDRGSRSQGCISMIQLRMWNPRSVHFPDLRWPPPRCGDADALPRR